MKQFCCVLFIIVLGGSQTNAQTTASIEWYNIHDGPAKAVDIPQAATLDRQGNLYITGRSSGIGSGQDYLTLKYSPEGNELLTLRYNGPPNSWDESTAIAVDDSGNIYVTGLVFLGSTGTSAVTIKYNQQGVVQWLRGAPPDSSPSAGGTSIHLDLHNNVYVAGSPALTVMKYTNTGTLLWSRTISRDTSMVNNLTGCVVDREGSVYLTGAVSEECPEGICRYDMVTLKYDSAGTREWVQYFARTTTSDEQPVAITIDSQENIIIVGVANADSMFIVKYSPEGNQLWDYVYDGPSSYSYPHGIVIDQGNNIIVGGTTWLQEFDYFAAKYSPAGTLLWMREYNHDITTRDFCGGVTVDLDGNVYLTGGSRVGFLGNSTCVTVKLNSAGDFEWSSTFNRPDNGTTYGNGVFTDSIGNVYIAGDGAGPTNGWDYIALKLNQIPVSVTEPQGSPSAFALFQNYPNPFNPVTNIEFRIRNATYVSLRVFDVLGREVATLVNEERKAGSHHASWDAAGMASGFYLYRLIAPDFVQTRKMILMH